MYLPSIRALIVTALAATAFVAQPATADARSKKYLHGYYRDHHRHYSRYYYGDYGRHRHWSGHRRVYYYSPYRYSYGYPYYYSPYRRSGVSVHIGL